MKKRKRKLKLRKLRVTILLVIILSIIYVVNNGFVNTIGQIINIFKTEDAIKNIAFEVPDEIYSPNVILINLENDKVLYEKNKDEKVFPASLTKIMTTIVALEKLPNLNEKIKLTNKIFEKLKNTGAAVAGFSLDESIPIIDLLYGIMLPSGAEAAIGIAEDISGSEENFVKLMNEKAKVLNMQNTHFANVTGLHNENHYTTVNDLSILLKYALKNEIFKEIFTTEKYTTAPTNSHPEGLILISRMHHKIYTTNLENGKILGGKTGYTPEAGLCLASLASVYDKEYILITTGAKGSNLTEQYNLIDAIQIYNGILK